MFSWGNEMELGKETVNKGHRAREAVCGDRVRRRHSGLIFFGGKTVFKSGKKSKLQLKAVESTVTWKTLRINAGRSFPE